MTGKEREAWRGVPAPVTHWGHRSPEQLRALGFVAWKTEFGTFFIKPPPFTATQVLESRAAMRRFERTYEG